MSSVSDSSDAPVLDRVALYEQVGDEADLLLKVIEMFRNDSVQVVAKLDAALASGDASEVQQGAHRIKGALLTLGGKAAAEVAMHLEHMGRDGDLSDGAGDADPAPPRAHAARSRARRGDAAVSTSAPPRTSEVDCR